MGELGSPKFPQALLSLWGSGDTEECVCSFTSGLLQPHGPPGSSVHSIILARIVE